MTLYGRCKSCLNVEPENTLIVVYAYDKTNNIYVCHQCMQNFKLAGNRYIYKEGNDMFYTKECRKKIFG